MNEGTLMRRSQKPMGCFPKAGKRRGKPAVPAHKNAPPSLTLSGA
ncbi:hypothetical protein [Treponema endosymbiont of Eucomonympha sp.]|nr:hypothetical protein [Treponema endosymbiont of Eucomonympha sp.]